jgi:hypothetical protein
VITWCGVGSASEPTSSDDRSGESGDPALPTPGRPYCAWGCFRDFGSRPNAPPNKRGSASGAFAPPHVHNVEAGHPRLDRAIKESIVRCGFSGKDYTNFGPTAGRCGLRLELQIVLDAPNNRSQQAVPVIILNQSIILMNGKLTVFRQAIAISAPRCQGRSHSIGPHAASGAHI